MRRFTVLLAILVAGLGILPRAALAQKTDPNKITAEEIAAKPDIRNAYEAMKNSAMTMTATDVKPRSIFPLLSFERSSLNPWRRAPSPRPAPAACRRCRPAACR